MKQNLMIPILLIIGGFGMLAIMYFFVGLSAHFCSQANLEFTYPMTVHYANGGLASGNVDCDEEAAFLEYRVL